MTYFLYMLLDTSNKISYVGYTNNLSKRLKLHNNAKGAKFTRGRKWSLAYTSVYNSKSVAMKNEFLLKKDYKKRSLIKKKYLKSFK